MATKNEFWSGFRVLADISRIEPLFFQLIPEFKKLESKKRKYYFNYYSNGCRIGVSMKNTKMLIKKIRNLLGNQQLNFCEHHNTQNEADFDSYDETDHSKIQKEKSDLCYKYEGTKYAIQLITELNVNSSNFDSKKTDIANKIKDDPKKVEILGTYHYFHFIMNPLCFFRIRNAVISQKYNQVNGGCIYDIEEEILDIINS